ncbi:MAG: prepilin-type N-terminal cleavage/methylation domain-containing protein [Candidatus Aenigmatarchaeota archaeon]
MKNKKAFTLIEVLLVIGIIILLAGAIIVAVNPGRQFAKARNTQRKTDTTAILNAIVQNMVDNQGAWKCDAVPELPSSTTLIATPGGVDLASCLVPTYLPRMPLDPQRGTINTTTGEYNTQYNIRYDPASGRLEVCAPYAELGETICTSK